MTNLLIVVLIGLHVIGIAALFALYGILADMLHTHRVLRGQVQLLETTQAALVALLLKDDD